MSPSPGRTSTGGMLRRLRREWALRPERNIQIAVAIVAAIAFALPVVAIVLGAFRTSPFQDGVWSAAPFLEVMTSDRTWSTLWNTVLLTVASVVPALLIAVVFAVLTTRTDARLKWLITGSMAVLVAMPPLFYALTWSMLGNETVGLINVWLRGLTSGFAEGYQWGSGPFDVESWAGLILVSTFRNAAFMYLILVGPFSSMDRALEEAARVSGASALRTFFGTQLPVLFPAISAVLIISTVASMEAFDVPVVLGVPAGIYVLPTEVFRYLSDARQPLYGEASAVSIVLLVILIALLIAERRMQGGRRFTTVTGKGARRGEWALGRWRGLVTFVSLLFVIIAVVLPLIQLVIVSISPYFGATEGWTLKTFVDILTSPAEVQIFLSTAGIAAAGAAIAVLATTVILWAVRLRRGRLSAFLDASQMLPMIIPGLLLALGIITVVLLSPARGLYGSWPLLMIALFIAGVPLASRALSGAIVQIPVELEEATRVSGGTRSRALWGVVLRLVLPSALNGWLLCFVVLSGTLAIPMLLGQRNQPMLAISVYDDYLAGKYTVAAAKFVIFIGQVLLCAVVVEIIKRLIVRAGNARRSPALADAANPDRTEAIATRTHAPRRRAKLASPRPADTHVPRHNSDTKE